jgi:peptidoglycan/xylan/chitin deacetylase (PgdA/CDA1 family)
MVKRTIFFASLLVLAVVFSTAPVNAQTAGVKKYVIFRDDDVAPWWCDGDILEAVNQVHMQENVPVTLAIVPDPHAIGPDSQVFQLPNSSLTQGVPPIVGTSPDNELLQDPTFLTAMRSISSDPLFEFAQHGYSHKDAHLLGPSEPSEFAGEPYQVQYEAIQKGRDDIKDAFGITPTTFVPPWDHGDGNTLAALQALGFTDDCSGRGDLATLQGQGDGMRMEAATVNIVGTNYTALTTSFQLAKNTTDQFFSDPSNDTLIVAYHWWTFSAPGGSADARKVQLLRDYIDYVKTKEGVQFTRLDRQVVISTEAAPGAAFNPPQVTISTTALYGAALSLMSVSGALTPYRPWLLGGVGIAYLLGFAWFVARTRNHGK